MTWPLYMDHHIPDIITEALKDRGVDVLTVRADHRSAARDPALLSRSTILNRLLFTFDEDFVILAAKRQREGAYFSGVVYAHPLRVTVGDCIERLELVCKIYEANEVQNQLIYLHALR